METGGSDSAEHARTCPQGALGPTPGRYPVEGRRTPLPPGPSRPRDARASRPFGSAVSSRVTLVGGPMAPRRLAQASLEVVRLDLPEQR